MHSEIKNGFIMIPLKKNRFSNLINYFVMFFVIALGGITTFTGSILLTTLIYFSFIFILLIKRYLLNFQFRRSALFIICILFLFFLQCLIFDLFSFSNLFGLIIILTSGLISLLIIGPDFHKYYIKIILFFSFISLIFFGISIFFESFYNLLATLPAKLGTDSIKDNECLIVYNFDPSIILGFHRNSGPFYEPGAFACYLNLALILNSVKKKIFNSENILLIVTILTTFSTAGYSVLAILLCGIILFKYTLKWYKKVILVSILGFFSLFIFVTPEFMKEKIITQSENQFYTEESHLGRFGSAKSDIIDLKGYYLTGRGLVKSSRFKDKDVTGSTNGTTDLLSRYGIIGFSFYLWMLYNSFILYYGQFNIKNSFSVLCVFLILLIGFSQVILIKPIFFMLLFYQGYNKIIKNTKIIEKGKVFNLLIFQKKVIF